MSMREDSVAPDQLVSLEGWKFPGKATHHGREKSLHLVNTNTECGLRQIERGASYRVYSDPLLSFATYTIVATR